MKKWNNPELKNLNVTNTNESSICDYENGEGTMTADERYGHCNGHVCSKCGKIFPAKKENHPEWELHVTFCNGRFQTPEVDASPAPTVS